MVRRNKNSTPKTESRERKEADKKWAEKDAASARKIRAAHLTGDRRAPSQDKIIADIKLRAKNNREFPGTCSRAYYRAHGRYLEPQIYDHFGGWREAQRAAGLMDSREASAIKLRRATLASEEMVLRYMKRHVLPYNLKRIPNTRGRFRELMVISDMHGEEMDEFVWETFLDVAYQTQPDDINLNGDIVNFTAVGAWSKDPHRILNLQQEINFIKERILAQVREVCPNARIVWTMGNHEYRLFRFLSKPDVAPLASLDCLNFDSLFALKELDINFACREIYLAPTEKLRQKIYQENFIDYDDCFRVTHGVSCATWPAAVELNTHNMCGTSGHVHRVTIAECTRGPRTIDWVTTGMASTKKHGEDFNWNPSRWSQAFNRILIDTQNKTVIQQPVHFRDGLCRVDGTLYERKT
jgi:hypothetical protein